jgi:hypothetical protein
MNIQIKKIILWAKKENIKPQIIELKTGALNVIHGGSKRGKTALIHIIDWCLGSSHNNIPFGTVRDNVSWCGLILKADDKEIFLARENTEQPSNSKIYYEISDKIDVPDNMEANYTLDDFKKDFNNKLGVPFEVIVDKNQARPSFRDFVTFNFQTQGIVADQNNLLYKTNLSDYRQRIRSIFNFAIGAESAQILENKLLKAKLQKELEELRKDEEYNKSQKQKILENNSHILLKAVDLGLLSNEDVPVDNKMSESKMLSSYDKLAKKTISDINIDPNSQNRISEQIYFIETQLKPIYEDIRDLQIRKNNLSEIINLNNEQESLLECKQKRLEISRFFKDYFEEEADDVFTKEEIEKLYKNLEETELDLSLKVIKSKNSEYISQRTKIEEQILSKTHDINNLVAQKNKLKTTKEEYSMLERFYVKIILSAKNICEIYKQHNISNEQQINSLEKQISNLNTKNKEKEYLEEIVKIAQNYLPSFAEFPYIDSFDSKELAVKIKKSPLSKPFYASDAGSGANWVAYHIAMLLGFHKFFIDKDTPVFNFLIFDQPSQVYFPRSSYDINKEIQIFDKNTEDAKSVREMFEVMQKSINDNSGNFQILVLDHASSDIWGEIEGIHEVAEWIGTEALIPQCWINDNKN